MTKKKNSHIHRNITKRPHNLSTTNKGGGREQNNNNSNTHRLSERLVRFTGDRPERHSAGVEALHDLRHGFHLLERDSKGRLVLESQQAPVWMYTK